MLWARFVEGVISADKAQPCDDWFILGKFRVTWTNAGLILQQESAFLHDMGLETDGVRAREITSVTPDQVVQYHFR